MKESFVKPEMEVIQFGSEDVIVTSSTPCDWVCSDHCKDDTCQNVCSSDCIVNVA